MSRHPAACYAQSPKHPDVTARVRCNRPHWHRGPHRKYRVWDYFIVAEWDGLTYSVLPRQRAPQNAPNP